MTNDGRANEIAVYLGLGTNVGDREANLCEAIARIEGLGLEVTRQSSIYETEPVGYKDQQWFLNQAIETKVLDVLISGHGPVLGDPEPAVTIQAEALLSELLKIELEMGRQRTIANGPRVIDIDLLLFGDAIIGYSKEDQGRPFINRTEVIVPHPRMHLRRFVLEPLCEIAPEIVHPLLKKTCREMLASVDDASMTRFYIKSL